MAHPLATVSPETPGAPETSYKASDAEFIGRLVAIAGPDAVLTDPAARVFFSTDIASRGATAEVVVRIGDVAVLSQVVIAATSHGRVVIPRGGGFSYTGGYTPANERSVIIDFGR